MLSILFLNFVLGTPLEDVLKIKCLLFVQRKVRKDGIIIAIKQHNTKRRVQIVVTILDRMILTNN